MALSKARPRTVEKPYDRVTRLFVEWNLTHKGKDEAHADSYWFRGPVLFHESTPAWRAVKGPGGVLVILVRYVGYTARKEWGQRVRAFNVPDLAVFSKYEGDLLENIDEMHERIRWIMFSQVRSWTDMELKPMPNKDVAETQKKKVADLRDQLQGHYRRYDNYSAMFQLGWDQLPTLYLDAFDTLRQQKIRDWNDPKAKLARERAHARKQAVKALDLDQDNE